MIAFRDNDFFYTAQVKSAGIDRGDTGRKSDAREGVAVLESAGADLEKIFAQMNAFEVGATPKGTSPDCRNAVFKINGS